MKFPRACILAVILTVSIQAQPAITSVRPEAAGVGDTITIKGTNMGSVTDVRFTANVGGVVGILNTTVSPVSASATQVKVVVPSFGFVPPGGVSPSSPLGTLFVRDSAGQSSSPANFYYFQASFGPVDSIGSGSTNAAGCRAATSFALSGGNPVSGNTGFSITLDNALPGEQAFFVVGSAPNAPIFTHLDAILGINPLLPFFIFPTPFPVDTNGRVVFQTGWPASPLGVQVVAIWGYTDTPTGLVQVSQGMHLNL